MKNNFHNPIHILIIVYICIYSLSFKKKRFESKYINNLHYNKERAECYKRATQWPEGKCVTWGFSSRSQNLLALWPQEALTSGFNHLCPEEFLQGLETIHIKWLP